MRKYTILAMGVTAGILTLGQPVQAIENSDGFILPSANIACISHEMPNSSPILRCEILSKLKPMPPQPASCKFDWGNGLLLTKNKKKAEVLCVGDTMFSPEYPTLNYGKMWKKNGYSCNATADGLTCTNGQGNGFFLNRDEWQVF
jgi:hypothetical protein